MIEFEKKILPNGLTVIVHTDNSSPLVAVNIVYNVGSKDEAPDKTGFAHLFEHLMFGGSVNIPSYDEPLQLVGGENNAFTNNDLTNYYITLPKENIETAFWLESDRMLSLAFSKKSLEVQRNVVIEEFNQRYLNQPYGDVWLLLRPLAYKVHPYQWATIGKSVDHIRDASLEDVKNFFFSHYAPNNAILTVAGDVNPEEIFSLAEKWFGSIEHRNVKPRNLPPEPEQSEARHLKVTRDVPYSSIYMAFPMSGRKNRDYQVTDLISDILSNGKSSRLFVNCVQNRQLFSEVNAFITGDIDPGLLVVTGRLADGVTMETAEQALWDELFGMSTNPPSDYELQKVKNRFESSIMFSEVTILSKAMNLGFYELLGDADIINHEVELYQNITVADIVRVSQSIFKTEKCSILYYLPETNSNDRHAQ